MGNSVPLSHIAEKYKLLRPQIISHCESIVSGLQDIDGVFGVHVDVARADQVMMRLEQARALDTSRRITVETYPEIVENFARIRVQYVVPEVWETIHEHILESCDVETKPVGGVNLNAAPDLEEVFDDLGIEVEHEDSKFPSIRYQLSSSDRPGHVGITIKVEHILDCVEEYLITTASSVPSEWGQAAQNLMLGFDTTFRKLAQMFSALHAVSGAGNPEGAPVNPREAIDNLAAELLNCDLAPNQREKFMGLLDEARSGLGTMGQMLETLSIDDTSEIPSVNIRPLPAGAASEPGSKDNRHTNRNSELVIVHKEDQITVNLSDGELVGMDVAEVSTPEGRGKPGPPFGVDRSRTDEKGNGEEK